MRHQRSTHFTAGANQPLAELAERQHGVVSFSQLLEPLGYSRSAIARASADGRLHRLYRGVYAVGHTYLSRQGKCLAAVFACGDDALLSHASAAWAWGISPRFQVPIEVTAPSFQRRKPSIVIHRSRILRVNDRDTIAEIPVTSLPRTLLDIAASFPSQWLRRAIERSEELQLFDLGPTEELLDRSHGHPGAGPLRRAIALYRPPVFTRSELEREFLALAEKAGLPRPATGFNEGGYELDVYWPDERFAVELDVFETHGSREAFERDRRRQEDLKLAGVEMIRVTGHRLEREPRQLVERVARLLALRRSEGCTY